MDGGLTSGVDFLRDRAKDYFSEYYQNPPIKVDEALASNLSWKPTLQFKIQSHLTVLAEVSETPYPAILHMRRTDIMDMTTPVSVYCVCPEEAYLNDQSQARKLIEQGFGLITVDSHGQVERRANCIPLIQRISDAEFHSEIKGLTPLIRRRLVQSFEKYQNSAPAGAADIAEVLEGFILKAGNEGVKKNWLQRGDVRAGQTAKILDAMTSATEFQTAKAPIGGVRAYISSYRNLNHHFPKNQKQAAKKYKDCRHAFLDGIKKVGEFRVAMKSLGLTGGLPS